MQDIINHKLAPHGVHVSRTQAHNFLRGAGLNRKSVLAPHQPPVHAKKKKQRLANHLKLKRSSHRAICNPVQKLQVLLSAPSEPPSDISHGQHHRVRLAAQESTFELILIVQLHAGADVHRLSLLAARPCTATSHMTMRTESLPHSHLCFVWRDTTRLLQPDDVAYTRAFRCPAPQDVLQQHTPDTWRTAPTEWCARHQD